MTSYTAGTVTVTNGSATVTGALTFWANDAVLVGDLFCRTLAGPFYEITAINSDTSITLDRAYAATTQAGVSYVILRLSLTRQSNSYVSAAVWDLVSSYGSALSLSASDQVLTLNKGVSADDALIVLRTAGGERWQIGTTADDDLKIMRSNDGSTYADALTIARADGGANIRGRLTIGTGGGVTLAYMDGGSGSPRQIYFLSGGVNRWIIGVNGETESGNNAGSNFVVASTTDEGVILATGLKIDRNTNKAIIPGAYSQTTASGANLNVAVDGGLARSTSAAKYKTDDQDVTAAERDALLDLRPISYLSLCAGDDPEQRHFGFIADDTPAALSALVSRNADGEPEGFQYERLTVHLAAMAQHHHGRLGALDVAVAAHSDTLADHEARIAALEAA